VKKKARRLGRRAGGIEKVEWFFCEGGMERVEWFFFVKEEGRGKTERRDNCLLLVS
jgi:hypothetical protein